MLRNLDKWLVSIGRCVLVAMVLTALLVMFAEVVLRLSVGRGIPWAEEASRFCLVWITLIGGALLIRESDGHPRVDLVCQALKPRIRAVVDFAMHTVAMLVTIVVAVGGYLMMCAQVEQKSPAMGVSMAVVYSVLPVGGLLSLVWMLPQVRVDIRDMFAPCEQHPITKQDQRVGGNT